MLCFSSTHNRRTSRNFKCLSGHHRVEILEELGSQPRLLLRNPYGWLAWERSCFELGSYDQTITKQAYVLLRKGPEFLPVHRISFFFRLQTTAPVAMMAGIR
jgi:hypothetical protein